MRYLWPEDSECFRKNTEGPYGYTKQLRATTVSDVSKGLGQKAMSFWIKTAHQEGYVLNPKARNVWASMESRKIDLLPTQDERDKFREFINSGFGTPWQPLSTGIKAHLLRRLTVYFDLEIDEAPADWKWSA